MISLFLCNGEHLDNYDDLQQAIDMTIAHWHEDDRPWAYVIRNESEEIVATIAPVKADEAVVVYAKFGTMDKYEKIEYVRNADGKLTTQYIRNGVPGIHQF